MDDTVPFLSKKRDGFFLLEFSRTVSFPSSAAYDKETQRERRGKGRMKRRGEEVEREEKKKGLNQP